MSRRSIDLAAGVPIAGFVGVNGAGKTLLAVESAIADLRSGRPVYSTVQITSEFGESSPVLSLRQLLTLENCTVLLDDVAVIFSARSTSSLPPEMVAFLQTLRHQGVTVRWTAPNWMRCDVLLRDVTQAVVSVSPMLRRHEAGNPWPRPRLVGAGLLDTSTVARDREPEKRLRTRFVIPRRLLAWGAYDTRADTPILGRHLQTGVCVDCGGSVQRERHSKARHEALGLPWFDESQPVVFE